MIWVGRGCHSVRDEWVVDGLVMHTISKTHRSIHINATSKRYLAPFGMALGFEASHSAQSFCMCANSLVRCASCKL